MKKIILSVLLFVFAFGISFAQTLVSTEVENKNAVLEEYTGIHCTYCPEGHAIAQSLQDDNPGDVIPVNIHVGSFAVPGAGEPDFRTPFGDALVNLANISGYPAGSMNRHVFPELSSNGGTGMGRASWTSAAGQILAEASPVNVGAQTSYNDATRELTVNVELYYTSNSPEASNFLHVALLQDSILGPQTGGGMGDQYEHNHMLRHFITGQWGDEITNTSQGDFVTLTYTYTIPADYNEVECLPEDCFVAVYVSEGQEEIYSGTVVPAINGTTLLTSMVNGPAENILTGTAGSATTFNFFVENMLDADEDFYISLVSDNEPANWESSFTINSSTFSNTGTITLASGVSTNVSVDIIPDPDAGFVKYVFSVQSVTYPNAPVQMIELYVISDVNTLLVHNQGAWGSGSPADFEEDYFTAFENAAMTNYASCGYKEAMMAANMDKLSEVNSIYFNVGWTFPSLTDQNAAILADFLDNGGNLFIAGQDIGWDTWDAAGNGTTNTQAFYTNYLHADYISDGSSSNSSVWPNTEDEFFGGISDFTITDIYGGMYPDQIDPLAPASSVLHYNNNASLSSGVRVSNGTYKVVYLGFDPSMATTQTAVDELIAATNAFFNATVGLESDEKSGISAYPNPTSDNFIISAPKGSEINIYSPIGKLVFSGTAQSDNTSVDLNTFSTGMYIVNVKNAEKSENIKVMVH